MPSLRRITRGIPSLACLALLRFLEPSTAEPILRPEFWVTDGYVKAMAEADGILHIGGSFSAVGPWTGAGVPLSAGGARWPRIPGGFRIGAPSFQTVRGGWFLGGRFHQGGQRAPPKPGAPDR